MLELYIHIEKKNADGTRNESTKNLTLKGEYDFSQLGGMIENMADSIGGISKEEKEQKEGEAASDFERGN